jgi:hypothetical protein
MKASAALLLLALGLLGCQERGRVTEQAHVSPLAEMDDERLWILMQAARVNPRCGSYYASSHDDPTSSIAAKCESFERRALPWFHANGAVDAEVEDVRDPRLWDRYKMIVEEIGRCRTRARNLPIARDASVLDGILACDPYEQLVRVERKTLEQAGYRRPAE